MANPGSKLDMTRRDFVKTVGIGIGALQTAAVGAGVLELSGCGGPVDPPTPKIVCWPIAKQVYTTAQQQVCPVALSPTVRQLHPGDVALYAQYKYSAWTLGGPLQHIVRKDLAPNYTGAPNAARLLYYFSISDIHIADKESPAQPLYIGWSAPYGPAFERTVVGLLADPAVDAAGARCRYPDHQRAAQNHALRFRHVAGRRLQQHAVQRAALVPRHHRRQGHHAQLGRTSGRLQHRLPDAHSRPPASNPSLLWYQVMGNHDQFWMGCAFEDTKTQSAHVGDTILNISDQGDPPPESIQQKGAYMGVLNGTTPYGDIWGAGPEADFDTPPKVVADANRHSLATTESTTVNWMTEFFNTTTKPVGHGFSQDNLKSGMACYSFVPKSDIPIKIIVLDDTVKGPGQADYAAGALDDERYQWLVDELNAGQAANQLMVIAAHVPILPQNSLTDTTPFPMWPGPEYTDDYVLNMLHTYPNLILWMAGHRHVNVVTPQPDPHGDPTLAFWEVETCSLRDHPQQFRTFDIRRNSDNTVSIIITNVDPAVLPGSPAYKSRGYALGAFRIFGATPEIIADTTSHSYNAELVVQLTPVMQSVISQAGTRL